MKLQSEKFTLRCDFSNNLTFSLDFSIDLINKYIVLIEKKTKQ